MDILTSRGDQQAGSLPKPVEAHKVDGRAWAKALHEKDLPENCFINFLVWGGLGSILGETFGPAWAYLAMTSAKKSNPKQNTNDADKKHTEGVVT